MRAVVVVVRVLVSEAIATFGDSLGFELLDQLDLLGLGEDAVPVFAL